MITHNIHTNSTCCRNKHNKKNISFLICCSQVCKVDTLVINHIVANLLFSGKFALSLQIVCRLLVAMLEEDCIVLSVLKGDVQTCLSLLCDGVDPNTESATGDPLLHLALASDDEAEAVALVQLLLVFGAEPNPVNSKGRSGMDVALSSQSSELISLIRSFNRQPEVEAEEEVVTRFNKYVFNTEADVATHPQQVVNNNGAKFLQQVADLFEENIKGVRQDGHRHQDSDEDITQVVEELGKIGFRAATAETVTRSEVCSTPCGSQRPPVLEVSGVSSINWEEQETFYSCAAGQTGDCRIAITEEYVIHDRWEVGGVSDEAPDTSVSALTPSLSMSLDTPLCWAQLRMTEH